MEENPFCQSSVPERSPPSLQPATRPCICTSQPFLVTPNLAITKLVPPLTLTPATPETPAAPATSASTAPLSLHQLFSQQRHGLLHYGASLCSLASPPGLVIDSTALSSPANWKGLLQKLKGHAGASRENSLEPSGINKSDAATATYALL